MNWILILTIFNGSGVALSSIKFDDEQACKSAGAAYYAHFSAPITEVRGRPIAPGSAVYIDRAAVWDCVPAQSPAK